MRSERTLFVAAAAAGLLCVASPAAQADGWIGSWGASDVFPVGPDVNFQTLRQFVRLSAGGKRVRIRFSNATGQYPLVIGAAHVAKPAADGAPGAIDPATDHALTFGGAGAVTVAPGAEVVSDPVEMELPAAVDPGDQHVCPALDGPGSDPSRWGRHNLYLERRRLHRRRRNARRRTPPRRASSSMRWMSRRPASRARVVTLGDSITDGYRSQVDANHRWPDRLAERLAARSNAAPVGVVNAGVSGNRILHDHPEDLFGPSALARLDRDVLSTPGLRWVVLMEGINDIGHSTSADASGTGRDRQIRSSPA